jgi:hypothetical protein
MNTQTEPLKETRTESETRTQTLSVPRPCEWAARLSHALSLLVLDEGISHRNGISISIWLIMGEATCNLDI